jgi:hypothetical protein
MQGQSLVIKNVVFWGTLATSVHGTELTFTTVVTKSAFDPKRTNKAL